VRLLITSDLHYNHPVSQPLAEELIERMNAAGGDVLLVIGDTAVADGDCWEQCLGRFRFDGPKLLVAGNHELWTNGNDSLAVLMNQLPRRAAALGWRWLADEPLVIGDVALVGSVGWYDYSFAQKELGIPRRFYENKISPGVAQRLEKFAHLLGEDVGERARRLYARWNDGVHVKLGMSDEKFLAALLGRLEEQLAGLARVPNVIAAVHCLPFAQLLPPSHNAQWDFAKAYLGSEKIGQLLLKYPNVKRVYCGHSHFPARARVGHLTAVSTGCGYRHKRFLQVEI